MKVRIAPKRAVPLLLLGVPLAAGAVLWFASHDQVWIWFMLGTAAAVSVSGST